MNLSREKIDKQNLFEISDLQFRKMYIHMQHVILHFFILWNRST